MSRNKIKFNLNTPSLPTPDHPPVIFLDVDGVLNSGGTDDVTPICKGRDGRPTRYTGIEDGKVNLLRVILAKTGAKVVWSSSWRESDNKEILHPYFWKKMGDLKPSFIGQTPRFKGRERGHEIKSWLAQNPQVKKFVILDDFDEMLDMRRQHVLTNPMKGLTIADANRAIAILTE